MAKYQNRDGVVVDAEQVTEGEFAGLWHITDKDGVEGHATDAAFQYNFKPLASQPPAPAEKKQS